MDWDVSSPLCVSVLRAGAGSPYCLRDRQCNIPATTHKKTNWPRRSITSQRNACDPDSSTVTRCPMSRPPDVIGATHVITSAAIIIRPIANFDRDGAWGRHSQGTGITRSGGHNPRNRSVLAITRVTGSVWATRVTGSVCRRTSIIISASAGPQSDRKQKEQESRPSRFRSNLGGVLRAINNIRFHIWYNDIRILQTFYAPELKNFYIQLKTASQSVSWPAEHLLYTRSHSI
jgi:hypothetical protein